MNGKRHSPKAIWRGEASHSRHSSLRRGDPKKATIWRRKWRRHFVFKFLKSFDLIILVKISFFFFHFQTFINQSRFFSPCDLFSSRLFSTSCCSSSALPLAASRLFSSFIAPVAASRQVYSFFSSSFQFFSSLLFSFLLFKFSPLLRFSFFFLFEIQ